MIQVLVDDSQAQLALDRLDNAVSPPSLSEFLATIGSDILQARADARFDTEGDDASGDWAPLAWPTQRIRYWQGFAPTYPINVRYGDLRDWVLSNRGAVVSDSDSATLVWPGEGNAAVDDQFSTAQQGKASPPTPPRPVAAANETDLGLLLSGITDWVNEMAGLEAT